MVRKDRSINARMAFNMLYKALLTNDAISIEAQLLAEVLRCAKLNKVLLHFLRIVKVEEGLQELRRANLLTP